VPLDDVGRGMIREVFEAIDQAVEFGFLPAAPRKDACKWCDYRQVCGPYEQTRIKLKDKGPLQRLHNLREMG